MQAGCILAIFSFLPFIKSLIFFFTVWKVRHCTVKIKEMHNLCSINENVEQNSIIDNIFSTYSLELLHNLGDM